MTVFVAVIGAALLHAVWNALVKGSGDKHLSMAAIMMGQIPVALLALSISPIPAPESWPYLVTGIALHFGYQLFLLNSYRIGDLTQVYPIARGSAPIIVAVVSVFFLGVDLQHIEIMSVLLIGIGILSMSLVRQRDGQRNANAAILALVTGCFIASYSLIDGFGARIAGTSLGFYGWLAAGNSAIFALFVTIRSPGMFAKIPRIAKRVALIGGNASFAAYALVMWAFTQAPIALVTALRETSIVFALLIGVFFLKERLDLAKVLATMLTLTGAILLKFSKAS